LVNTSEDEKVALIAIAIAVIGSLFILAAGELITWLVNYGGLMN
jgi:hypothetical protein